MTKTEKITICIEKEVKDVYEKISKMAKMDLGKIVYLCLLDKTSDILEDIQFDYLDSRLVESHFLNLDKRSSRDTFHSRRNIKFFLDKTKLNFKEKEHE